MLTTNKTGDVANYYLVESYYRAVLELFKSQYTKKIDD